MRTRTQLSRSLWLGAALVLASFCLAGAQTITGVDPVTGLPSNSILIQVAPGSGGELSTLIYPYTDGDPVAANGNDHFGKTGDGGAGMDFDDCAGGKYAVRWDPKGGGAQGAERSWGTGWNDDGTCKEGGGTRSTGIDGDFVEVSQVTTAAQLTPGGEFESVIVTEMAGGGNAPMQLFQKTIIRGNNRWFTTVYYIVNIDDKDWTDKIAGAPEGVSFFQGASFRMNGTQNDDTVDYDGGNGTIFANDQAAVNPFLGFSGLVGQAAANTDWDTDGGGANARPDIWIDIRDDAFGQNGNPANNYVGGGMRWNLGPLKVGETHVFAVIWGIGADQATMQANIDAGSAVRYDTGILSIDTPAALSSFMPGDLVTVNATAALFGLVDATAQDSEITITGPGGCAAALPAALPLGTVDLAIPAPESAAVPSFVWDTTGCGVGNYTIMVCTALPPLFPIDQNPANDCQSITVTLVIPNVGITSIGSPANGADFNAGDLITVSSTAELFGTTNFLGVDVEATVTRPDGSPPGCALPANQLLGQVDLTYPGMTLVSAPDFNWDTTGCNNGGYDVQICTNLAGDLDPSNDCSTVRVTLGGVIDAGIASIDAPLSGSLVTKDSIVTIRATAQNYGEVDVTVDILWSVTRPDGQPTGCVLPVNQLADTLVLALPGSRILPAAPATWDTAGCKDGSYEIRVCTDMPGGDGFPANDCQVSTVNIDKLDIFINGVDTTLIPPGPNNSLLVAAARGKMGQNVDGGGEISTILFPYNGGVPAAAQDHTGHDADGLANNIDDCAGAKIAVRWDPGTGDRQWGSGFGCVGVNGTPQTGLDGDFDNVSYIVVKQHATPSGQIESVIVEELFAPDASPLRVIQKLIIRENNAWFASVYYITNESPDNFDQPLGGGAGMGVAFFQGVDWNFNGSFLGDEMTYDGATDIIFGVDLGAVFPDIAFGGFSALDNTTGLGLVSNAQGLDFFNRTWEAVRDNNLNLGGGNPFPGDAAGALRWDLGVLPSGQTVTHPIIWGLGVSLVSMEAQIVAGMAVRWDTGIFSIDAPATGTKFVPGDQVIVDATAALFGVVDAPSLDSTITITGPGGCAVALPAGTSMGSVNLAVPSPETAAVPPFLWDTMTCATGTYTITVCTNLLPLDQTPANDCQSVLVDLRGFTLAPDGAQQTVAPGSTADYSAVATNATGGGLTVEFDAGTSSQGWGSQILDGATLIAEDTNGDGVWDFIVDCVANPLFCDGNLDGNPETVIAATSTFSFTFRKLVPILAPLGVTDTTILTGIPSAGVPDDASFLTSTSPPPTQTKTLHLHPGGGMDTFPDTSADNTRTQIPPSSSAFFQHALGFQTPFTLVGGMTDVDVSLFLGTGGGKRNVTVTLFATNGAMTISIGSATQDVNTPNNPNVPTLFRFTLNNPINIPAGYRMTILIQNNDTGAAISVWHDGTPTPSSRIDMQTTTYIQHTLQGAFDAAFPAGVIQAAYDPTGTAPGAWLRAQIDDPFGAEDICFDVASCGNPADPIDNINQVHITITDPGGFFLVQEGNPPGCETTNSCVDLNDLNLDPLTYRANVAAAGVTYEYPLPLQSKSPGTYTVCMEGFESNGVTTGCTFQFVINSATAIELVSFDASGFQDAVHVRWVTGQEIGTLGYNLYRSTLPDRGFVQINPEMVGGLGYSDLGGSYLFVDGAVEEGRTYFYLLEEVELSGEATQYGPVAATTEQGVPAPLVMSDHYTNVVVLDELPPEIFELAPTGDAAPPIGGASSGIFVSRNSESDGSLTLDIDIHVPPAQWGQVDLDGTIYDTVNVPGYGRLSAPGAPDVPAHSFLVDVPSFGGFSWELTGTTASERQNVLIAPAPPPSLPQSDLNDAQDLGGLAAAGSGGPLADPAVYGSNELYPGAWAAAEPGPRLGQGESVLVSVYPVQTNPTAEEASEASEVHLSVNVMPTGRSQADPSQSLARQWDLAGQGAVKVLVSEEGIQRLTGADLEALGIDRQGRRLRPSLFHHGREIPVALYDGGDGSFDPSDAIEFYGEPANTEFTKTGVYWLVLGRHAGRRPEALDAAPALAAPVPPGTTHLARSRVGDEVFYFSTLNAPGEPHWFHGVASARAGREGAREIAVPLVGLVQGVGDQAILGYDVRGVTHSDAVRPDHHLRVELNGELVDEVWFDGHAREVRRVAIPVAWLLAGDNLVRFVAVADGGVNDTIVIRSVEILYPRDFQATGEALRFDVPRAGRYRLSGFAAGEVRLYDVADPRELAVLSGYETAAGAGGSVDVNLALPEEARPTDRTILAVTDALTKRPALALDVPSSLSDEGNRADYLIVSDGEFIPALAPLVELRRSQGLGVLVADIADVYDEFSYGEVSPEAIRQLLLYAHDHWAGGAPRYLLLVGDASYDATDRIVDLFGSAPGQSRVPTILYDNEYFRTGSDNALAQLDGDLIPDVGVGRIPAQTIAEVETVVSKILTYEATPLDEPFARRVVLVSDNAVGTVFRDFDFVFPDFIKGTLADVVAGAGYDADLVVLPDAVGGVVADAPAITDRIVTDLTEGALLLAYAGHGSALGWADESIFRTANPLLAPGPGNPDNVAQILNPDRLAVVTVFDCLNGYFINPFSPSLGEALLREPNSGAVAFWGPAGLTPPNIQHAVGAAFFRAMMEEGTVRLGDAARAAFAAAAADPGLADVVQTWTLLGDPALRVRINHPPVVELDGPAQAVVGETLHLDASGSFDPNEDALSFQWQLVSAPPGVAGDWLAASGAATADLVPPAPGDYRVRLSVVDSFGATASGEIGVAVGPGGSAAAGEPGSAAGGGCNLGPTSSASLVLALLFPMALLAMRRRARASRRRGRR